MSTAETLRYDADQEIRDGHLETCPKCSCRSLVTTLNLPATRIDPECSVGYCVCRESDMVSVCCGAPEHPDQVNHHNGNVEGFCGSCREGTGFERACPCEYEWG